MTHMRIDCVSWVFFLLRCMRCSLPRQLSDVAEGLNYLHLRNIIHGDLKGVRDYSVVVFSPLN